jgi:hypothetical protein|tara:strand:- start:521 stop:733 length:213 start_codon:yes stop_codon:yes gene_type:complete
MEYDYESDWDDMADAPYIQMELDIRDVHQLYKSISQQSENFTGDENERERIDALKDFFYRMILEYKFQVE